MQKDCEVYVDPEEDEVFFGCVSERERNVCAKLVRSTGSSPKDDYIKKISELDENNENIVNNKQECKSILNQNEPINNIFETNQELNETYKNNTTVELEHNYSTPMKSKIDKTILTTPKSVVKADKDGGFLKVLSEIALVKAEAEGDKKADEKKEDEDKENQMIKSIPVIKVTEPTPEKAKSPSLKIDDHQPRRFRIIYNSPQNEDKTKSFENCKNFKNKCLDENLNGTGCVSNNNRNSIDLITFNKSIALDEVLVINEKKDVVSDELAKAVDVTNTGEGEEITVIEEIRKDEEPKVIAELPLLPKEMKPLEKPKTQNNFPSGYRFSKEARKIVEVLKKSAEDDTLDFTIDEIDVEDVENSLLAPEPAPPFDVTVIPNPQRPEVPPPKPDVRPKTVEKDRHKLTPVLSQSKIQGVKYFSERRMVNTVENRVKKCVKKLPLEDKRLEMEKAKGLGEKETSAAPSSRIPVFGAKNSRIPLHTSLPRPLPLKTTPLKTPTGKTPRNPKYKNIESPINAYINNKPTSLVLNVKPELKKSSLTKVWRPEGSGSAKKPEEKTSTTKPVRLPYVEYRSAASYEIEKRPESRLPRLAPTVQKLIGSHSPRVLKHEGRFFVNASAQKDTAEDTILADYEVSLVVSQTAQKTAIK